jgi:predicted ATP-grasp superfamily ATP-dependent carboligase
MSASKPADEKLRILVGDGETRAALAVTRSLAAHGCEVHVASRQGRSLAGASRYAASEQVVGDPGADPQTWGEAVAAAADRVGAQLFFPITEASLGSVYQLGLERKRPVLCPDREAYQICVDKHTLLARAADIGIDVPRGCLITDPATLERLPQDFKYPVVLKPRRTRFLVDGRWQSGEVRIVHEESELLRLRKAPDMRGGILLQEFVPGHGEAIFLLMRDGEPLVRFAHRRLREKPPTGGQSVLRESISPDSGLLDWSEKLLGSLRWSGAAMVEYRRGPDGRAVLMEVNPRLWGSLQLAIDAGVDFPSLLLDLHLGRPLEPVSSRPGVRTRWLLGDVDHLLICLRRPAMRRQIGRSVPELLLNFLRSFVDGTRDEILRRDDWRPFLHELRAWWRE